LRRLELNHSFTLATDPVGTHRNDYSNIPDLSDKAVANLERWFVADFLFIGQCERWMLRNMTAE